MTMIPRFCRAAAWINCLTAGLASLPYAGGAGFLLSRLVGAIIWLCLCSFMLLTPTLPAMAQQLEPLSPLQAGVEFTRSSYRVGPGDILSLYVYHQPDLTQTRILVRDDGFASFNGVGQLHVAGRTVDDITAILKTEIGELVIDPQVTVTVSQMRTGTIYVAGAVKKPGMVQLNQPATSMSGNEDANNAASRVEMRLSNVLAHAGGLNLNADLSQVQLKTAYTGEVITVDLWKMLKAGDREVDLWVQSGDTVYVPSLPAGQTNGVDFQLLLSSAVGPGTFPVRVIGEVNSPGVYSLDATSASLNTAIAQAGGYKPGANKKVLAIRRFEEGDKASTLLVNPNTEDTPLRPNDVVFVSEKKIYSAGRFMETVAKVLSPFSTMGTAVFGFSMLGN